MRGEISAKTGQILLCNGNYAQIEHLFPTFCVCRPESDADYALLADRQVILMGCAEFGDACLKHAITVSICEGEIPLPSTPAIALKWAQQVKIPYISESAAQAPSLTGSTPKEALPDAAGLESAPLVLNALAAASSPPAQAKEGADPEPDDILTIVNDTAFRLQWSWRTAEQREAIGEAGFARAIRIDMAKMAEETIVGQRIAAQEAENEATGHDEDGPLPGVPEHMLDGPENDSEPVRERPGAWVASAEEWALPVDPFQMTRPPAVLDTSDLPKWLHALCADEAALKGTDPGVHAMTKFGCLAAWCHESWRLQIKRFDTTWRERAALWTFTYGHSSDGKTIALNMAAKAAVDLDTLAGRQGAVKLARWQSEKRIRDIQIADYEKRAAKNELKAGEVMPEPADPPEIDKKRFTDANIEGLRTMLALTPKGWLHTDELAAWISGMGRYIQGKNSDGQERSIWMQAWDGGVFDALRATGNISIKSLSICITACLTDSALLAALGTGRLSEEGLVQRFMIYKCRDQVRDQDHELNEEAAESFRRCLANLRVMRPINDKALRLAPAAYAEFQRFEEDVKDLANSDVHSAGLKSSLLKFRSHCPRLALTLHLAMRAESNQDCGEAEYVDDAMITAIGICRQLLDHTVYFWDVTMGEGHQLVNNRANQICELIACFHMGSPTFGIAKIASTYRKWWPDLPAAQKAQLISAIADMNWWGPNPGAYQQSPGVQTSYKLHPALHRMFDQHPHVINARIRRRAVVAKFR